MPLLDEIIAKLVAATVVDGATGWTSGKDVMPPEPDKIVAVFQAGGEDREKTVSLGRPAFQVRVRGIKDGAEDANTRLKLATTALHNLRGATLTGTLYVYIFADGDAIPLGYDQNRRPEVAQNFRCAREE